MDLKILKSAVVITPTIGKETLADAIDSVQSQTYDNLRHLLVCDGLSSFPNVMSGSKEEKYLNPSKKIEVSLLANNVGGHGFYGHRVYAAFSHLVDDDYVLFLDEDNFYEPTHVESLIEAIEINKWDWAYSLRKIVDVKGNYLLADNCESLGRWPVWCSLANDPNFLVDTSSFCFKTSFLKEYGHHWHWGWGADRRFLQIVASQTKPETWGTSGLHTLNYRLDGNPNSVTKEFFEQGNQKYKEYYASINHDLPWHQI